MGKPVERDVSRSAEAQRSLLALCLGVSKHEGDDGVHGQLGS